jgi:hypothetical protein
MQTQSADVALDSCNVVEDGGQLVHPVDAAICAYFPAAHAAHDAVPLTLFAFPASHAVQSLPPLPLYPALQVH